MNRFIRNAGWEIWAHLPAWYVYIGITSITFSYISLLPESRYGRAFTFVYPAVLFVSYYLIRIKSDERISTGSRRRISMIFILAFLVNLAMIFLLSFPITLGDTPQSHSANYKICFEISVLSAEMILLLHCYRYREKKDFFIFLIPALIYGMTLESSGVSMNFFFEDRYLVYLPVFSAPLVTMLGWVSAIYVSMFMSERIMTALPVPERVRNLFLYLFLIPVSALLVDLQLDPFTTEIGLWKWNPLLYGDGSVLVMGVPLLNFFAWFGAVFSFSLFYFIVMRIRFVRFDQLKKVVVLTLLIPVMRIISALVMFSLAGLVEGFNGPSLSILKSGWNSSMPF